MSVQTIAFIVAVVLLACLGAGMVALGSRIPEAKECDYGSKGGPGGDG